MLYRQFYTLLGTSLTVAGDFRQRLAPSCITNYGANIMISSKSPVISGDFSYARVPHPFHWQQLVQADERLILSPSQFLERWEITKVQMARMCFCSPSTVSRWLSSSACHQDPGDEYRFRLGYIDSLWNMKQCK
jgi:hypothetical protein